MMKKKLAVFCVLIICSIFLFACKKTVENPEGGKGIVVESDAAYWLCGTGIEDGPDYIGGICKVYFRQDAIILEGKLLMRIKS